MARKKIIKNKDGFPQTKSIGIFIVFDPDMTKSSVKIELWGNQIVYYRKKERNKNDEDNPAIYLLEIARLLFEEEKDNSWHIMNAINKIWDAIEYLEAKNAENS